MDADRFETLLRALSSMPSRRTALRVLAAAVGGAFASRLGSGNREAAAAKGTHHQRRGQAQGKKKPCPPCKKRKKGKCKGLLPDGSACAGGTCQNGSCVASSPDCPSGLTSCAGVCKDLQTDEAYCGACGQTCTLAQPSCCSAVCTNFSSDANNCGACGLACGSGQTCCSGVCHDLRFEFNNCGICDHACAPGQTCCSGVCSDTLTDEANCGSCGHVCGANQFCNGGACCLPDGEPCNPTVPCCVVCGGSVCTS